MKKLIVFTAVATLTVLTHIGFADVKVGVIDLNKILTSAPQVAKAKQQLQQQFTPRQKAVAEAQKKLQDTIKSYEKNSITMKEATLKDAQQKIMNDQKQLQELQATFQRDLMEAQNKSMEAVLKHIESIVTKIATTQKLDLVLTKMSTAYSHPKFDVTEQVITALKK